jgi:predicted molibdopterin-dependent oxidoreductase YjgC
MKTDATVTVTIDNKPYAVASGISILDAAEQNGISIPTLCAHKELTPYGGCRMCIVEVEGMRNLPTACTTPVSDGMIIRTDTAQVKAMRTEILQLFLSEHTSSCLICEEKDQCREYMGTIRKAGVTTGCRYCSNDGQCELQDVVEDMDIKDIKYPIYYRNLRVEKEDPFYERDYNLCILCGRCVRMCQEVRVAHVLAFNHRGRETVIGPAYGRTHLGAGCEFCGACVSVCPTGSLTEKARAYEGKPDREELTTCTFCGVGCQMRLLVKDGRVIGSLPEQDDKVNNGQLCVKGRFCITELVGDSKRAKHPFRVFDGTPAEVTWPDAIDAAAEKLGSCAPDEFGMLVSPNCTNEDLYVAQKFARVVMRSHNVDSPARTFYGPGLNAYLNLMKQSVPLSKVRDASTIICVGLDIRFGRSVVGVELRRAFRRGAKIVTVNPHQHSLAMISEHWIQPVPGEELDFLKSLVKMTAKKTASKASGKKDDSLAAVAQLLADSKATVILLGSEFLQYGKSAQILEAVDELARNTRAGILPLPAQNNLYGSLLMGAYPELLPGAVASTSAMRMAQLKKAWKASVPRFNTKWNSSTMSSGKKLKVLYLVGEMPPVNGDTNAEFVISQNIYPPDSRFKADLVLPTAAFTESDGTFVNGEGRVQRVRKAVEPPGEAMPDWMILCRIAQKLGIDGFNFKKAADIHKEMASLVDGFGSFEKPKREARPLAMKAGMTVSKAMPAPAKAAKGYPFILSTSITEHTHRGFPLSAWVDGTRALFSEERVNINPEDARKAKLSDGDEVVVSSNGFKKNWPVGIRVEQPKGRIHVTLHEAEAINPNPHPVKMRKK